jgi:hypothetical protein
MEQFNEARRYGGCVVQAHPFRHVYYIDTVHLSAGCVNAVEAANAGNASPAYDAVAMAYAGTLGLPVTAGSDIHNRNQIETGQTFGVYLDKRMDTIQDYVKAIREHTIAGLRIPKGRCNSYLKKDIALPVDIRDAQDRSTGQNLWEFLEQ